LRSIDRTTFDLEITGWIAHTKVPALMADADVCVLPLQQSERTIRCMPVKLYEYMALSKPVIAPDFGEIRRFVTETGCGILVDTSDPHALAAAISQYYENPSEGLRQGNLARRQVEEELNWAEAEEKLLAVYPSPLDSTETPNTNYTSNYHRLSSK
jgi:glycosyltransferase involved in cell wall biosynthesis